MILSLIDDVIHMDYNTILGQIIRMTMNSTWISHIVFVRYDRIFIFRSGMTESWKFNS